MCFTHLRRVSADDATTFGWVSFILLLSPIFSLLLTMMPQLSRWLSLSPLLILAASNSWMRVMLLVYDLLDETACAGRPFEPWGGTATTLWHLILRRRLV